MKQLRAAQTENIPSLAAYGHAAQVQRFKAKGLGLPAIAREFKMLPCSVHKALQLAA